MSDYVTVKQLIKAVEMIQSQRPDAQQQLLKELRGILQAMDPRVRIGIQLPRPPRVGKTCEVMDISGILKPKRAAD